MADRKLNKVEKYILKGYSDKGLKLLSKIELKCENPAFLNSIGDIYFYLKDLKKAQIFYLKSYRVGKLKYINNKSLSQLLKALYQTGSYEAFNSIIQDPDFKLPVNIDPKINDLIIKNSFAFQYKQDSVSFTPVSLNINSKLDEYFPSMTINSDVIIYTSRDRNSEFQDEDFFISRKFNNLWSEPIRLGDNINSEYREGSLSVSLDGQDLFFASCNRPDSYGSCDLYFSTLINDTLWSDSYNIGASINTKFWESQPSISADGKILFFSSNRHGGYGGTDIWMSRKINNSWLEPINLGPAVNTSGDEYTPFLHYDNQTFYFSSKGHSGFGGFDLYVANIDNFGMVKNVQNLGYPINTHYDESGLIVSKDGLKAYYNSNSSGDLDIYSFNLPHKFKANSVAIINGLIIDSTSRKGVTCNLSIRDNNNSWDYKIKSDDSGTFSCSIPIESSFSITVNSQRHDFFSFNYVLHENEYLKSIDIVLNRINLGNKINLDNIYYEFDDYSLKEESLIEIKNFSEYLLNSRLKIEIGGHTDSIGSIDYNYILSTKRAKSVYNALVKLGVPKNQLSYKGYGYNFPINNEDTDLGRLLNRRTEIKIIGTYEK